MYHLCIEKGDVIIDKPHVRKAKEIVVEDIINPLEDMKAGNSTVVEAVNLVPNHTIGLSVSNKK